MWLRIVVLALMTALSASAVQARTYAAIVQDYRTGEVLHSRSADTRIYPASLTKMMTLYMLFDAIDAGRYSLNSKLTVSKRAAGMPASKLGLKRGQTILVRDAIRALVVKSANDVAVVVAEALAKSEIQFSVAMTARAHSLGMSKTKFMNASGLPNRRQKSTARDMAKLATALIRDHSDHYHFFSLQKFEFAGKTYRSHNKVVGSYPGADGLKTGYIRASGFNLASSAVQRGNRLVAIVIGGRKARSRDAEMVRLLDLGFDRMKTKGPLIAVAPPKPKPQTSVAAVRAPKPASADIKIEAVIQPHLQVHAKPASSQSLPVVHAPRRNSMVATTEQNPNASLGLLKGPQKIAAKGRYGVQVGAYHDPEKARLHALRIAQKLPSILLQGDVTVSGLSRGKRTVYRSRVVGFNQSDAERACKSLKSVGQECLVVQTAPLRLAASNG